MQTHAVRLHGKNDLRLEAFELPDPGDDEISAIIVSNSICMSDHKAAIQGAEHKRVPKNIAEQPVIIGHEFSGVIEKVGKKYSKKFKAGEHFGIQPAIHYPGRSEEAPGYSFRFIGGQATRIIIPREVLERDCLLHYRGRGFFKASLAEPVSCIVRAFKAQYHCDSSEYVVKHGIVEGGAMALLAGAGPMGLVAIDLAVHGDKKPRLLVVTDIDQPRLDRAAALFPPAEAKTSGVELHFVNTQNGDPVADCRALSGGKGYDDVFVFAPVAALIGQASAVLGLDGCLNFFAGPNKKDFSAPVNFYDVHYSGHHIIGSTGGTTGDMREALDLSAKGQIDPAVMVTHIGGLDAAAQATLSLPSLPGGKKLIYTGISLPLTHLDDFAEKGQTDPLFAGLEAAIRRNKRLWSAEAEEYLLSHADKIEKQSRD